MTDTLTQVTEQLEEYLQKSEVFKDAKIFQREEEVGDEGGDLVLYLYPNDSISEVQPWAIDFRKIPVSILIKFRSEGLSRLSTEDERDAPRLTRNRLVNGLQNLLKGFNQAGFTTPVYIVHQASLNLKFQATEEIKKDDTQDVKRVLFVWDFHTVERYAE